MSNIISELAELRRTDTEFEGRGDFLGFRCSARERNLDDGACVLCARAEEPWTPTLVSGASELLLCMEDPLWVYVYAPDDLGGEAAARLLAPLELWRTAGVDDLGFSEVSAGGVLFVLGSLALPVEISHALALDLPPLRASACISYPAGYPFVRVRARLDALRGAISDPVLELSSPAGPSRAPLEARLRGTISLGDGGSLALSVTLPFGEGTIVGSVEYEPRGSLGGLLPFDLPSGTSALACVELAASEDGLVLERLAAQVRIGRIALVDGLLTIDELTADVLVLGPGRTDEVTVASLSGRATFGKAHTVVLDAQASSPPRRIRMALAEGSVFDLTSALGDLGLGEAAAHLPRVTVETAEFTYDADSGSLDLGVQVSCGEHWSVGPFAVSTFRLAVADGVAALDTVVSLGSTEYAIGGTYGPEGWTLHGEALTVSTLGQLLDELTGRKPTIPTFVRALRIERLAVTLSPSSTRFDCELTLDAADLEVHLDATVDSVEAFGTLSLGASGPAFDLVFDESATAMSLRAAARRINPSALAEALGLQVPELLATALRDRLLDAELDYAADAVTGTTRLRAALDFEGAKLRFFRSTALDVTIGSLGIDLEVGLAELPIVGSHLPSAADLGVRHIDVLVSTRELTAEDVAQIEGVPALPPAGLNSTAVAFVELQSGGTPSRLALVLAQPRQKSSHLGPASLGAPASPPPATTWLNVQRIFGPVAIRRIGLRYDEGRIWLMLDAGCVLGGVDLELLGLGLGFSPTLPPSIGGATLSGIAVSSDGPTSIRGALSAVDREYLGQLRLEAASFQLSALGAYATTPEGTASLFAFAVLDRPLGGPPAFYVLGVAVGFGFNRSLSLPTPETLADYPFVSAIANDPAHPSPFASNTDVHAALEQLRDIVKADEGENWLALGVRFTTFRLIESVALLTAKFGRDTEIDLLGLSKLTHPQGAAHPMAYAELSLVATYRPSEGVLSVLGRLSDASYVLSPDCHLSGGFAFRSWFSGEHAGDFVFTLGGYHPAFACPDWYPQVPRLAALWRIDSNLTVKGELYFALTPSTVMAGGSLEALWQSGDLKAWFDARVDFLLCWKPFHYEAEVSVSVGASYRVDLWLTSFTVTVHLGVDVRFWGPSFAGRATIDLSVLTITVCFGNSSPNASPISWREFKSSFLPGSAVSMLAVPPAPLATSDATTEPQWTETYCFGRISAGLIKDLTAERSGSGKHASVEDGERQYDWIVNAEQLQLVTYSAFPSKTAFWRRGSGPREELIGGWERNFGLGPANVADNAFGSEHSIVITAVHADVPPERIMVEPTPILENLPAATWKASVAMSANRLATANRREDSLVTGALTGFALTAKPRQPDVTLPIATAQLLLKDLLVRTVRWGDKRPDDDSSDIEATEAERQTSFASLNDGDIAERRSAVLDELGALGILAGARVDVARLAAAASERKLRPPVLSTLGGEA